MKILNAQIDYNKRISKFKSSNAASGLKLEPVKDRAKHGHESFYALRKDGDKCNGIYYITRSGTLVYELILSGFCSDDHDLMYLVVLPKLDHLKGMSKSGELFSF